jgi:signal transduction histidine kinase
VLLNQQRGAGIPEEALRHSYERFYQAESLWIGTGTGLGLASILL